MSQFISRSLFFILAAISLASCSMTTDVASSNNTLAIQQAPLTPTVSQTSDGAVYTWEFTVAGSMASIQHDMTDSLLNIVGQVQQIRTKG